jgi:hypothetical protein
MAIFFVYSWIHECTPISFCEHKLYINKNTYVDWNDNYMREVCAAALLRNPSLIGGAGLTVEIDESLFSKSKNNGHILPEQ